MIDFEEVTLTRPGPEGPLRVLSRLSFTVPPGKVFAVLGPSGAGKSTVLRLAARLEDPDEGRILYDGTDIREADVLAHRRRVGLVFQEPVLFGETVEENLRFAAEPAAERPELPDPGRWLSMVGLPTELLSRASDSLSVGQRQRVAFARALVAQPRVLLLDEPTSALDPQAATGILRLIRDLRDRHGLTVLLVSHIIEHARQVADRVLVLKDGEVMEEGTVDLFAHPAREETRAFLTGEEE